MPPLRLNAAFTRREQRWGLRIAALLWVLSVSVFVALVAWSVSEPV
jgi:CHASE2 domain-containing sensor protein